jgi:hypothetical protein
MIDKETMEKRRVDLESARDELKKRIGIVNANVTQAQAELQQLVAQYNAQSTAIAECDYWLKEMGEGA